ncbi:MULTISPECIES: phosphatidylglycerol lysyltransferase domain-containing protein [unclassified Roseovarius]|uniref:phosphatidylglycerol lysyltransferase domain-containing protein n=1 Tax=unclassified Roseovarius TaxID=2614913 RepID=UPI00273D2AC9|nr:MULTISPECIES: phosphatidylglycerol lysyltransferase domain-containing protein [unclassified Roseovarius]
MQNQWAGGNLRRWPLAKLCLPLLIGAVCLWLVQRQMGAGALSEIGHALTRLHVGQWVLAALATAISFWAVGQYDVLVHRHYDTGYDARSSAISGSAAIALAQLFGMGVFVGTLARWRTLPGLRPSLAARITLSVTGWFLFGLIGVIAATTLIGPVEVIPRVAAMIIGLSLIFILVRSILNPYLMIFSWSFKLLPLRAMLLFPALALIDTLCAAAALWILMPSGIDLGFATLFPVFLLALTAALITGTPGGVGPFELIVLTLLPTLPQTEIMAGIVAFRLIYYALPGIIAMAILHRPFTASAAEETHTTIHETDLREATRAELGVSRQNRAWALHHDGTTLAVTTTPQAQVALFDPLNGEAHRALPALLRAARRSNRSALIYKASARHAAPCRRAGLKALHICDEVVLDPQGFTTDGAPFRQLRRKLRQADKAGITVRMATTLPVPHMRAIDAEWQARSGPARGFSIGVFCPDYLRHQLVLLAYQRDVLVGFASFHSSNHEICLDLMRLGADAPDGTMHLLIRAAIDHAARESYTRLSLAALPPRDPKSPFHRWIPASQSQAGLCRFKTCFGGRREPLYALSTSWLAMGVALADVMLAIHRPNTNSIQTDHEDYEFASISQT